MHMVCSLDDSVGPVPLEYWRLVAPPLNGIIFDHHRAFFSWGVARVTATAYTVEPISCAWLESSLCRGWGARDVRVQLL